MGDPQPTPSPSDLRPAASSWSSVLLSWKSALAVASIAVLGLTLTSAPSTSPVSTEPYLPTHFSPDGWPVFTPEELAEYDGRHPRKPLYLAVLGEVFDVTTGAQHYQQGTGYHCFVGRDASAAFMTGKFQGDGLTSDVSDLAPEGLQAVLGWRDFYAKHETYRKVGLLAERYYDLRGRPTESWHEMDRRRREVEGHALKRELILKRYKDCNSKSVMAEPYFTVWCDANSSPQRYIRELVLKPLLPSGQEERRCVCATEAQFQDEGVRRYHDCAPLAIQCQRARTS
eukprot:GGOE01061499.1.p1 GENE.GGOE01061499.1~~GGOE01061499.1.p1  ORF type:complete len:285 (+),score=65.00 GGOE01061499.1:181-1035(+)